MSEKSTAAKMVTIERKSAFDWEGLKSRVEKEHWRKLRVTIRFREKLHAGKPAQLNAANAMLKARGLEEVVEATEIERPTDERAGEVVNEGLCEFHRREGKAGIWWPTNNFKACFKENWSVLGYRVDATPYSKRGAAVADEEEVEGVTVTDASGKIKKLKKSKTIQGSRGYVAEALFVKSTDPEDPDWIRVGDKPDGIDQNVSHTTGPKGPQSSIKRNEYVLRPTLTFEFWMARAGIHKVPDESFADTLLHAQEHGTGANRSQGIGTFDIVGVEET